MLTSDTYVKYVHQESSIKAVVKSDYLFNVYVVDHSDIMLKVY
jgi:hypothetical protein